VKRLLIVLFCLFFTPLFSFSQSLSNSKINAYKYIVVKKTNYTSSRKKILRELKKAGYNVLDINDKFPLDLEENPGLALYVSSFSNCSWICRATVFLDYADGTLFWESATSKSGWSSKAALKSALVPMLRLRYKYDPSQSVKNIVSKDEWDKTNSISDSNTSAITTSGKKKKITKDSARKELKELKELLDLGLLTQEEFDNKAVTLKKIILEDNHPH